MKSFKYLKTSISLFLVLVMALLAPAQALGASNGKYVSEVYVAYGKNAEEAKKTLEDKGFTPIDGNVNENGDTYVMMGYQTTDNIRDAVTDIAVMNMDGNFNTTEYKEVLRQKKTQVGEMLGDFMSTIKEYRANYRDGKEKAVVVHDLLNKLTDDDSGLPLGDLFNGKTLQDKVGVSKSITEENKENLPDLLTILMQGNTVYIQTVESLLAVAADTNDNTWIDRFAETDYDDLLDELEKNRPDLNTASKQTQFLEAEYGEIAQGLSTTVATLRRELIEYEKSGFFVTDATQKDVEKTFGEVETADDESEKEDIISSELAWAEIGALYECLKNYEGGNFAKGELLDFFMEEVDENDMERYIPMAASFTEGQRGGMDFVSFKSLLRYAFLDFDSWKSDVEKNADLKSDSVESVYSGINREMFSTDGSIAYTGRATREKNTSKQKENEEITVSDEAFLIGVLWTCTVLSGLIFGTLKYMKTQEFGELLGGAGKTLLNRSTNTVEAATISNANIIESITRNSAKYGGNYYICSVGSTLFAFATIFLAIAAGYYTYCSISQKDAVTLKPIPKYFVDNKTTEEGESFQLNYQAAECNRKEYFGKGYTAQTGSSADLNADEGKQWLALYVSKNSMAGNPVLPDFSIKEVASAPDGMNGNIHTLGENGAVNLTDSQLMNYSALYSTYKTVKDKFAGESKAYMFFKRSNTAKTYDEKSGNMTATTMRSGNTALFGFGGLAIGVILGAVCTAFVNKGKKKKETA